MGQLCVFGLLAGVWSDLATDVVASESTVVLAQLFLLAKIVGILMCLSLSILVPDALLSSLVLLSLIFALRAPFCIFSL